ncbi:hypothetical protein C2E23DRAFT_890780 [Lenzites betulinus]|nr:hypothetical protein C2E23DRAFT_890780 [Lenzites betulinus]
MSQDATQPTVREGPADDGASQPESVRHASLSQVANPGAQQDNGSPTLNSAGHPGMPNSSGVVGMGPYSYGAGGYHAPGGGLAMMNGGWDMMGLAPHLGAQHLSPMMYWSGMTPGGTPDGRGITLAHQSPTPNGMGQTGGSMPALFALPGTLQGGTTAPSTFAPDWLDPKLQDRVSSGHPARSEATPVGGTSCDPSTAGCEDSAESGISSEEAVTITHESLKSLRADVIQWVAEAVEESLQAKLRPLIESELEDIFGKDGKSHGSEVPQVLQNAVHADMRILLGVREMNPSRAGTKKSFTLPDPLGPGEDARCADDGAPLHNPDWYASVDAEGVNKNYVSSSVSLVQQNAEAHHLPPPLAANTTLIEIAVKGYFKSMKRKYLIDNGGPVVQERHVKKRKTVKNHARRQRLANIMRIGMEAFEVIFGEVRTVGLPSVVCTPCVSDAATSDGMAGSELRDEYRKKADVGVGSWELRTPLWRSRKLTRLYMVLAVLSRFVREHEDVLDLKNQIKSLVGDAISEANVSPDVAEKIRVLRARYQAKVEAAVKGWSTILVKAGHRIHRFRGPLENAQTFPPKNLKKHTVYKEFINDQWVGLNEKNARMFARAPSCPTNWTILDLELPDSLIPVDDLAWLAKVQDNGYDADEDGEDNDPDELDEEDVDEDEDEVDDNADDDEYDDDGGVLPWELPGQQQKAIPIVAPDDSIGSSHHEWCWTLQAECLQAGIAYTDRFSGRD